MPILSNTNKNPYFDDFDKKKNFYRMMFVAGRPVQARELTQLQTIINNQFEEFASRFFKNGDVVVNGGFELGLPTKYVRLSSITQGAKAEDFIGYVIRGVTSNAEAEVIYAENATDTDDITLFISYIDSGVNADQQSFIEGEILESTTPQNFTAVVGS